MPTANPIVANTIKSSTALGVKQEPLSGTLKPANTIVTPSPLATPSTLRQVQVPTPVLQPAVQVQKTTQAAHQQVKIVNSRSLARPGSTHQANSVQRAVKPSSPGTKSSKKKKAAVSMATAQSATASTQGENTGRWTAEEHRLFLQGLEQHGKGWKKIASLIKSRTVVQIRTHAQKYFQKIAKARQNGEEGEVSMENRERVVVPNSTKRRRSGTKRKAISSVVASAAREGKKQVTDKSRKGLKEEKIIPLPVVAPALAPYVYPMGVPTKGTDGLVTSTEIAQGSVPSITTARGTISGAALEDSLFRFLTPMPNEVPYTSGQVNDVARQAGANPITLPSSNKTTQPQVGGEVSPTGVADLSNWAWNAEPPAWYAKGADVDELLNEAEALDWLADSGDLNETYNPPPDYSKTSEPSLMSLVEPEEMKPTETVPTFVPAAPGPILETPAVMSPTVSAGNMPPMQSLFESGNNLNEMKKEKSMNLSSVSLFPTGGVDGVTDENMPGDNFLLEDAHFVDEQDFVTVLLDQNSVSATNLNHLGQ